MLSSLHRFHGLNSLSYAYKHGKTVRGALASLKYAPNQRRQAYRAAIVVSRKVDKSAVVRNRIRRRLYAAIQTYADQIVQPYDLIFTVFSVQIVETSAAELQQLVGDLLERAGLLSTPDKPNTHGIVDQRK